MPFLNLTDAAIAALKPPASGQAFYRDTALSGLAVRISAGGRATYILEKAVGKRTRRITIAECRAMRVKLARDRAKLLLAQIAEGVDPVEERRRKERAGATLNEAYQAYLARRQLKARTVGDYDRVIRVAFADWADRPLAEITRARVQARFAQLRDENGPAWANLCMRLLRAVFNFAAGKYADDEGASPFPANPVRVLSETRAWAKVERRRTLIQAHDLPAWRAGVQALTNRAMRDYLLTLLFTGLRRREAASLRWDDVDLERRTLTVQRTKNGKPHTLPLPGYLHGLLSARKALAHEADPGDLVFPGAGENIGRAQKAVLAASGVAFTCHDLRRNFSTAAEALDIPAYTIKRLLNHADGADVTAGYLVISVERLRAPMERIADYFCSAMGEGRGIAPSSVVELRA